MTMNRDRSHSNRGHTMLRPTRVMAAAVVACLLALAPMSLGASAAVRTASPRASQTAVKHATKHRKKRVTCKKVKKKGKKQIGRAHV